MKATNYVHVIKLGGSLLDLPDVAARLKRYCDDAKGYPLLVVGGGRSADTVRHFDRHMGLDETAGHWLAVRAMALNAHILAAAIKGAKLAGSHEEAKAVWKRGGMAMVEPTQWLKTDEQAGAGVQHVWAFTSDSIAAHIASRVGAKRLTLLKSVTAPQGITRDQAVAAGWVDSCFVQASKGVAQVEMVNLREEPFEAMVLG